jgi:hypothetical protein
MSSAAYTCPRSPPQTPQKAGQSLKLSKQPGLESGDKKGNGFASRMNKRRHTRKPPPAAIHIPPIDRSNKPSRLSKAKSGSNGIGPFTSDAESATYSQEAPSFLVPTLATDRFSSTPTWPRMDDPEVFENPRLVPPVRGHAIIEDPFSDPVVAKTELAQCVRMRKTFPYDRQKVLMKAGKEKIRLQKRVFIFVLLSVKYISPSQCPERL